MDQSQQQHHQQHQQQQQQQQQNLALSPYPQQPPGGGGEDHLATEYSKTLKDLIELKVFLTSAPANWTQGQVIKQHELPTEEIVSCIYWNNVFYVTGTDIVRCLTYRFNAFGRVVRNKKKFEEGIFSDLRNLKCETADAILEEPKSPFLDFLYKKNCVRTQKKQKVFHWFSVGHDRLFLDALERDLKKESLCKKSSTEAIREPAISFHYDSAQSLHDQLTDILKNVPEDCAAIADISTTSSYLESNGVSFGQQPMAPPMGLQSQPIYTPMMDNSHQPPVPHQVYDYQLHQQTQPQHHQQQQQPQQPHQVQVQVQQQAPLDLENAYLQSIVEEPVAEVKAEIDSDFPLDYIHQGYNYDYTIPLQQTGTATSAPFDTSNPEAACTTVAEDAGGDYFYSVSPHSSGNVQATPDPTPPQEYRYGPVLSAAAGAGATTGLKHHHNPLRPMTGGAKINKQYPTTPRPDPPSMHQQNVQYYIQQRMEKTFLPTPSESGSEMGVFHDEQQQQQQQRRRYQSEYMYNVPHGVVVPDQSGFPRIMVHRNHNPGILRWM